MQYTWILLSFILHWPTSIVWSDSVQDQLTSHFFTGLCERDYGRGCPVEWSMEGTLCVPSPEYIGPCSAFPCPASAREKREIARHCYVDWPCAGSCQRDFTGCPKGWAHDGPMCTAPPSARGTCLHSIDFGDMSSQDKASWAAMCGEEWPCSSR